MRVLVIGCSGSGKTMLSKAIAAQYRLLLIRIGLAVEQIVN